MNISLFAATMQCLWRRRGGREAEERGFESNVTKQIKQIKYIHNNWNRLWSKRDTTEMVLFDKAEDSRLANNAWVSFWWHCSKLPFIDKHFSLFFSKVRLQYVAMCEEKAQLAEARLEVSILNFSQKKWTICFILLFLRFCSGCLIYPLSLKPFFF